MISKKSKFSLRLNETCLQTEIYHSNKIRLGNKLTIMAIKKKSTLKMRLLKNTPALKRRLLYLMKYVCSQHDYLADKELYANFTSAFD